MEHEWQKLTAMTNGKPFRITKVYVPEEEITIEGNFQLPPLGKLGYEDQVFVAAFVKTHGSIKQMEAIFGISYPTVKNRLNAIASRLDIVDVKVDVTDSVSSILDKLERGDIDVSQALQEIR
ncbi:MAG: DUF2089 domain-containing protein [Sphaerochaeta sp.]|nr:DUF2089 domain-containing protein [Sphaerochaeta sp.]